VDIRRIRPFLLYVDQVFLIIIILHFSALKSFYILRHNAHTPAYWWTADGVMKPIIRNGDD